MRVRVMKPMKRSQGRLMKVQSRLDHSVLVCIQKHEFSGTLMRSGPDTLVSASLMSSVDPWCATARARKPDTVPQSPPVFQDDEKDGATVGEEQEQDAVQEVEEDEGEEEEEEEDDVPWAERQNP